MAFGITMTPFVIGLESTYKELKLPPLMHCCWVRLRLESTYKELKLCHPLFYRPAWHRLESTYKELKQLIIIN